MPFHSGYRPIWVGLGAVAFDLVLAVIITSLLRVRIGYSRWRWVHMLTYAMWPIALVHGLGTGSDTRSSWMWWVDGVCTFVVLTSVVIRLHERAPIDFRLRRLALVAVITVPLLIAVWTLLGPMKPNWQKKKPTQEMSTAAVVFEDGAR